MLHLQLLGVLGVTERATAVGAAKTHPCRALASELLTPRIDKSRQENIFVPIL